MRNKYSIMASLVLAAVTMLSAGIVPVSAAERKTWGPQDRATFTWDKPASYPTFNSITDNPSLGDERNFVRVREAGTENVYEDNINIEAGKEYEVYVYVHNNAAANLNESGKGVAQNVALKANFPTKLAAGDAGVVKGTINASNAKPTSVWDEAYLNANSPVYLSYVPNSATIHNGGSANGQILDGESLFGKDGARLAYDNNYWGIIPGCNEFAGYVTYRIKADVPGFWTEKTVSAAGANDYKDTITASVGDTLDFKITYENTGTTIQNDVTLYDTLPNGLEYVPGTLSAVTPSNPNGIKIDDSKFSLGEGFVIGGYNAGEKAEITYQAKIVDNTEIFACGETTIYNEGKIATANGTETDKTKIKVVRDCGNETTGSTMPSQLPKTGPAEIALAGAIVALVAIGGGYFIVSRNKLKKAKDSATGSLDSSSSSSDIVKDSIVENDKK